MGDVSEFKKYKRDSESYRELIEEVRKTLDSMAGVIHSSCVQLAMLGEWKEWNDKIPVGAVININDRDLAETADKNISALINLYRTTMEINEWLDLNNSEEFKDIPKGVVGHIYNDKTRAKAPSDPAGIKTAKKRNATGLTVTEIVKTLNAKVIGTIKR